MEGQVISLRENFGFVIWHGRLILTYPEARGAGLAPQIGLMGVIHGGIRDARLDRAGRSDRMAA
jgi:hypothetical protein